MKILVIDDDVVTLRVASLRLRAAGHTVVTRSTALGSSKAVSQEAPDCVIIDVDMPALRGDSLSGLLAKLPSAPKLILHSSLPEEQLIQAVPKSGAIGYILKSQGAKHLVDDLNRLLKKGNSDAP